MTKGVVKDGTPIGSTSLCRTCTSAHILQGYRESERITICRRIHPNLVVPFVIHQCSSYYDKNRPTWEQMEDLAITVLPGPLKPVGFNVGSGPAARVPAGFPADGDE